MDTADRDLWTSPCPIQRALDTAAVWASTLAHLVGTWADRRLLRREPEPSEERELPCPANSDAKRPTASSGP